MKLLFTPRRVNYSIFLCFKLRFDRVSQKSNFVKGFSYVFL
nr:MAG TPA: hypothetical protein [Caudoviricetes sp.]